MSKGPPPKGGQRKHLRLELLCAADAFFWIFRSPRLVFLTRCGHSAQEGLFVLRWMFGVNDSGGGENVFASVALPQTFRATGVGSMSNVFSANSSKRLEGRLQSVGTLATSWQAQPEARFWKDPNSDWVGLAGCTGSFPVGYGSKSGLGLGVLNMLKNKHKPFLLEEWAKKVSWVWESPDVGFKERMTKYDKAFWIPAVVHASGFDFPRKWFKFPPENWRRSNPAWPSSREPAQRCTVYSMTA